MPNINDFFADSSADKNTLLMVDYLNLVYRTIFICAGHGKKEMLSNIEMYAYWKHMMVNNLINSVKTYNPNRVVIAIDSKYNWRKKIYPEYKENRKGLRDNQVVVDFKEFFPILEEFTASLKKVFTNFYFIEVEEAEGDDIVAVLAKSIGKEYKQQIVISNDGDYKQLLKIDNLKLWNPLEKKWVKSLNPDNDLTLKVLIGDKSDNIPAVKSRVGKGTATKILKEGLEDYLNSDSEVFENYKRNKQLIDWDMIPSNISKNIKDVYNKYKITSLNSTKLLMFFASTKLTKLAENYSSYSKFIAKVK